LWIIFHHFIHINSDIGIHVTELMNKMMNSRNISTMGRYCCRVLSYRRQFCHYEHRTLLDSASVKFDLIDLYSCRLRSENRGFRCSTINSRDISPIEDILQRFQDNEIDINTAQNLVQNIVPSNRSTSTVSDDLLQSFATLDHERSERTGFPEVIFGQGKTATQIASILEDMAWNVNEKHLKEETNSTIVSRAILATR
jgi:hypothetical protein